MKHFEDLKYIALINFYLIIKKMREILQRMFLSDFAVSFGNIFYEEKSTLWNYLESKCQDPDCISPMSGCIG